MDSDRAWGWIPVGAGQRCVTPNTKMRTKNKKRENRTGARTSVCSEVQRPQGTIPSVGTPRRRSGLKPALLGSVFAALFHDVAVSRTAVGRKPSPLPPREGRGQGEVRMPRSQVCPMSARFVLVLFFRKKDQSRFTWAATVKGSRPRCASKFGGAVLHEPMPPNQLLTPSLPSEATARQAAFSLAATGATWRDRTVNLQKHDNWTDP